MTKTEAVCELAIRIANDDSHGYSQANRWGNPDFDCSSLVIWLWTQCGVDVKSRGATYTGNMLQAFLQAGFRKVNPATEQLLAGDILLNVKSHTALYIGDNRIVEAAGSETGTAYGNPGDQTGQEIRIHAYYNFPWDYILRYTGDEEIPLPDTGTDSGSDAISYSDMDFVPGAVPLLQAGDFGPGVAAMQGALSYHGFYILKNINGVFDSQTDAALRNFQTVHRIEVDGVAGQETWTELFLWR